MPRGVSITRYTQDVYNHLHIEADGESLSLQEFTNFIEKISEYKWFKDYRKDKRNTLRLTYSYKQG